MVIRNTTFSMITLGAKVVASVGLLIALARLLPREAFGTFTYAFSVATILGSIVDYGFSIKLLKDLTEQSSESSRLVTLALASKVCLALVALVGAALFAFRPEASPQERNCLLLISGAQILFSVGATVLNPYKCTDRFERESLYVGIDSALTLAICGAVVAVDRRPDHVALGFLGAKLISAVLMLRMYSKEYGFDLPALGGVGGELIAGLPYAVHLIVGMMYLNIDTVILREFVPLTDIALYQAGMRIVVGSGMALAVINSVLTPRLAALQRSNWGEFVRTARVAQLTTVGAGVALLLLSTVGRSFILDVLYGSRYRDLAPLLVIFGVVMFLRYSGAVYGVLLTVRGRQSIRAIGVACTLAFMVMLDFLVIPRRGIMGAALVLLAAHVLLTVIYAAFVQREYRRLFFLPAPALSTIATGT